MKKKYIVLAFCLAIGSIWLYSKWLSFTKLHVAEPEPQPKPKRKKKPILSNNVRGHLVVECPKCESTIYCVTSPTLTSPAPISPHDGPSTEEQKYYAPPHHYPYYYPYHHNHPPSSHPPTDGHPSHPHPPMDGHPSHPPMEGHDRPPMEGHDRRKDPSTEIPISYSAIDGVDKLKADTHASHPSMDVHSLYHPSHPHHHYPPPHLFGGHHDFYGYPHVYPAHHHSSFHPLPAAISTTSLPSAISATSLPSAISATSLPTAISTTPLPTKIETKIDIAAPESKQQMKKTREEGLKCLKLLIKKFFPNGNDKYMTVENATKFAKEFQSNQDQWNVQIEDLEPLFWKHIENWNTFFEKPKALLLGAKMKEIYKNQLKKK
jgi:hypothetical protein